MDNASRILFAFEGDVQHLHGNLFRVKRNKIKIAKAGVSVEDGQLIYGNPRWFKNEKGEIEAKGISTEKSKMEELRNSIQDEGLENPIRLRVVEGKKNFLEIVNGERRFRSIEELCERKVKCFDSISSEQRDANEVYEWIDARIDFMNDKTALRVALKPNETSEIIGDLANLNLIKNLRAAGYDDQEILNTTGKSISWLRESEKIISLDEKSYNHFCEDKINRKVAIHLSQIEDVEERLALLEKITALAVIRHSEKKKEINKKKQKAEQEVEIEEAKAELAKKYGDEEEEKDHKEKSVKAKSKVKKLDEESQEIENSEPTATSKDLEKVTSSKPLTHNKIQSIYIDTIAAIIQNEGFDDEGESYGFDMSVLYGIAAILDAIMTGEKDIMQVLADNCSIATEEDDEEAIEEEESLEEGAADEDYGSGDDDEEIDDDDDEDDGYGDDDYDYDDAADEEETPIELEKEFEEAAINDEEDFD